MTRLLALLFVLLPTAAAALSCSVPNAAQSVEYAMTSGSSVRVVEGTLVSSGFFGLGYRLEGSELRRGGWQAGFDEDIDVDTVCAGPWCGHDPKTPETALFLLRQDPSGDLTLTIGPCGGTTFEAPDAAQKDALLRCVRNKACAPEDVELFNPHY